MVLTKQRISDKSACVNKISYIAFFLIFFFFKKKKKIKYFFTWKLSLFNNYETWNENALKIIFKWVYGHLKDDKNSIYRTYNCVFFFLVQLSQIAQVHTGIFFLLFTSENDECMLQILLTQKCIFMNILLKFILVYWYTYIFTFFYSFKKS